jgi:hypothetical protein
MHTVGLMSQCLVGICKCVRLVLKLLHCSCAGNSMSRQSNTQRSIHTTGTARQAPKFKIRPCATG